MSNSAEAIVVAALNAAQLKNYPDEAPPKTTGPYVVYQAVGGQDVNDFDGPDVLENARMQVAVWSESRVDTVRAMRAARAALVAAGALPIGAPVSVREPDTQRYGSRLDFSIWYTP